MTVGCGGGATRADLAQSLIQLAFAADMINLEFAKVAAAFAETDEYDEQGFDSPISWIKANCHLPGGAAADRVCVGEQLEKLGQSRMALSMGEIGFAHFAHIARTSAKVGGKFDEERLLRHARKESVARFRNTCLHANHVADPKGVVDEEKQGVEARCLNLYTADDGAVLVKGILDKVGGATLKTALEPWSCLLTRGIEARSVDTTELGRLPRSYEVTPAGLFMPDGRQFKWKPSRLLHWGANPPGIRSMTLRHIGFTAGQQTFRIWSCLSPSLDGPRRQLADRA